MILSIMEETNVYICLTLYFIYVYYIYFNTKQELPVLAVT